MHDSSDMTYGQWLITLIITMIPLVNIIMLLVWAFGSSAPASKQNWAKALLTLFVIVFVLSIALSLLGLGGAMMAGGA